MCTNAVQTNQLMVPTSRLIFAASKDTFLENRAWVNSGRNAAAQSPINMAVARAMMLGGIKNASPTLARIMMPAPTLFALREEQASNSQRLLFGIKREVLKCLQTSCPAADPMVWNIELRVDMAAANNVSMNSTITMSGMDALMYKGMILSVFNGAPYLATSAAVEMVPPLFQK